MVFAGRRKNNKNAGEEWYLGKYEIGRTLGEGNFGKVKYTKDIQTQHSFAIKIIDKTRVIKLKISDQIKKEISALKLLKHPNVVRLHKVFSYSEGKKCFEFVAFYSLKCFGF
ncbi:hypothetical protein LXL04_012716 [Taraxacum kok-saghyz]